MTKQYAQRMCFVHQTMCSSYGASFMDVSVLAVNLGYSLSVVQLRFKENYAYLHF
jgi:hypothetical protein